MIVRYNDGRTAEAVLVSRTGDSIRVAMPGAEDFVEFREIHGVWVSEDCEPVAIDFALEQIAATPAVSLADCICPPELADRLITLLYEGEPVSEPHPAKSGALSVSAACCIVPA